MTKTVFLLVFLRVFDKARYSHSASYFRSHQNAWKHRILSVKHAISIGKITENIDNLRRKPLHRNTTSERLCDRQIVKSCATREEIAKTGSNKTASAIAFYHFKRKNATENTHLCIDAINLCEHHLLKHIIRRERFRIFVDIEMKQWYQVLSF